MGNLLKYHLSANQIAGNLRLWPKPSSAEWQNIREADDVSITSSASIAFCDTCYAILNSGEAKHYPQEAYCCCLEL